MSPVLRGIQGGGPDQTMQGGPIVLVVRPRAQALAWIETFTAAGIAAHALPLINILPAPDAAVVKEVFGEMAQMAAAQPVLIFVSPNAVTGFFAAVGAQCWPEGLHAAAPGPGTVAALKVAGVPARRIVAPSPTADQLDSEALWERLRDWPWQGRPVCLVRGNGGREWLGDRLRNAGAQVRVVQSYARAAATLVDSERVLLAEALAEPRRWVWMFGSSQAIECLETLVPHQNWEAARALVSHPRIGVRARSLGFGVIDVVAPTQESVLAALRA